jgi:hypothetical protein
MRQETRIDVVERWRGMPVLPKNWATLNVMEDDVEIMRLVRITSIVEEYVRTLSALDLTSDPNRLAGWIGRDKNTWSAEVW